MDWDSFGTGARIGTGIAVRNLFRPGAGINTDPQATSSGPRDAAGEIPPRPEDLPSNLQNSPGGTAVDSNALPDLSRRQRELMVFYGLREDIVRREVRTEAGGTNFIGEILADLHSRDASEVEQLQRSLFRAGFYNAGTKASDIRWGRWDADTLQAAVGLFDEASRLASSGDQRDWRSVLADAEADASDDGGGIRTTTTSRVNLSSEMDAGAALQDAMTRLLGRAPRAKEVRAFRRTLNAAERANPVVVSERVSEDDLSSQQFSQGGISQVAADRLAEQEIQEDNGVERNRFGVMSYMQAFEQAIGG